MSVTFEQPASSIDPGLLVHDATDVIRVLLAARDPSESEELAAALSGLGFVVRSTTNAAALLASVDNLDFDVLVLEWNPLDAAGIEMLAALRRRSEGLPVIVLAGQALAAHESLAFDNGATDFILRSRGLEVLARRLRRAAMPKPRCALALSHDVTISKLNLERGTRRAFWNGQDVGLTLGEYSIVELLVSPPGTYRTYRAIYDRLRGEGFIAGYGANGYWANVRSAIKRIRGKFRDCDPNFNEVTNFAGFGYCWNKPA